MGRPIEAVYDGRGLRCSACEGVKREGREPHLQRSAFASSTREARTISFQASPRPLHLGFRAYRV